VPKSNVLMNLDDEKIIEVTKNILLIVHSSYGTSGIWNNDENKAAKCFSLVKTHIKRCSEIGAWGLVLHTAKCNMQNYIDQMKFLKPIAVENKVKILIEMTAGKPDKTTFDTPEKLNVFVDKMNEELKCDSKDPWWGICVDTSHLWALKQHIREKENMDAWLAGVKNPEQILLFHLNGSQNAFEIYKDKHALPFEKKDKIWYGVKPEESGVASVVNFAKKYKVPIILEPHDESGEDLAASLKIITGLY
jgi:endonuclease IV